MRSDNSFTKEGEYWSSVTHKALPQGIDYSQRPSTEGASQFIIQKGKKARIRTWDAAKNEWSYTRTGILWAANKQIEVIVEIPTVISGRNASTGREWQRVGWMPYEMSSLQIEKILVKESLTPRQRAAKVREVILAKATDSNGVVFSASGEVHTVDPDREFRASLMETHIGPRGPVSSAVIQKPLTTIIDRAAGVHPQRLEWLPYPEGLCKEAFNDIDDKCCVPRQMVEVLAPYYELAELQDNFDDIQTKLYDKKTSPFEKSWRDAGVTPRMVLEWCRERKIPRTILHGAKACEAYKAEGGKPLVGCWWEGHAYFWKGHAAVKVARRGIPCESQAEKLAKYSVKNNTPHLTLGSHGGGNFAQDTFTRGILKRCGALYLNKGSHPEYP